MTCSCIMTCEVRGLSPCKFERLRVGINYDMTSHFFNLFKAEPRSTLEYNVLSPLFTKEVESWKKRTFSLAGSLSIMLVDFELST